MHARRVYFVHGIPAQRGFSHDTLTDLRDDWRGVVAIAVWRQAGIHPVLTWTLTIVHEEEEDEEKLGENMLMHARH